MARLFALTAVVAALVLAAAGTASAARPCTQSELQGSRAPAQLRDMGLDTQDEPLIAGDRYRIVVVRELAISDSGADPVDSSIRVTTPNGPPLTPTTEDGRPAYDFTPTGAGKVRVTVSWDDETSYQSGQFCSASLTVDLPVVERTLPTVRGRFSRGPHSFGSSFLLRLFGKAPQEPGKVNVIVRARKGTTRAPKPRGRAVARFRFTPTGRGGFETSASERRFGRTFFADIEQNAVRIYPYNNIAFGRTLKFGFSIEVVQNGRRIGGMRAGAACRRRQFRGHSAVKCRAVGLRQHP